MQIFSPQVHFLLLVLLIYVMYNKVYFEKNWATFCRLIAIIPFQNMYITKSFGNTSILGKSILDFVSPNVKLHNPYCHSFHTWRRTAPLPQAKVIIVIDLFMAAARRSCGNLCMPFSAAYSPRAFFFFFILAYDLCLFAIRQGWQVNFETIH